MFYGDFGGRQISLGGASRGTNDRAALLERQRLERLERENARQRVLSALTLQKWIRGLRVRRAVVVDLLCILNTSVSELESSLIGQSSETRVALIHRVLLDNIGGSNILTLLWMLERLHARIPGSVFEHVVRWLQYLGQVDLGTAITKIRMIALVKLVVRIFPEECDTVISFILRNSVSESSVIQRIFSSSDTSPVSILPYLQDQTIVAILMRLADSNNVSLRKSIIYSILQSGRQSSLLTVPSIFHHLPPIEANDICRLSPKSLGTIAENVSQIFVRFLRHSEATCGASAIIDNVGEWLVVILRVLNTPRSTQVANHIAHQFMIDNRSIPMRYLSLLLRLIPLTLLEEETVFQIATRSNTLQLIAERLVLVLSSGGLVVEKSELTSLVSGFSGLIGKVIPGIISSSSISPILSVSTLESVAPLLNRLAYKAIVEQDPARSELLKTVRSLHEKKHLFPNLKSDSVWVIPGSADSVPAQLDHPLEVTEDSDPTPIAKVASLIEELPHVIPFAVRVNIFAESLASDQRRRQSELWQNLRFPTHIGRVKRVRREYLLEDGLNIIEQAGRDILRIEFVNSENAVEAGIDGGGLFKEFMHMWTTTLMSGDYGLFSQITSGKLVPSVDGYSAHPEADRLYRAAGRAVGKALYELLLLETHFSETFLSRVLGKAFAVQQLEEVDEALFRNLQYVADCDNVDQLCLTMSVPAGGDLGDRSKETELIPGGREIAVTNENKNRYVLLASWFHLSRRIDRPAANFAAGLAEVVPLNWLRIFSPHEINLLISGEQRKGFSIQDLRDNVELGGGYTETSVTILHLWQVLEAFSDEDRSAFLAFVTSAARPPLLGFKVMHPRFAINRVPEVNRLPTASTCANLLKLPDYQNIGVLREKLLLSIYSQSGFDLS